MNYTKINGGWSPQRIPFSKRAIDVFFIALSHRRSLVDIGYEMLKGSRFRDDWTVLARLESMFSEEEFMQCPGLTIDKALIDAAQSDHWYQYEKDYEWPEIVEDEISDDE